MQRALKDRIMFVPEVAEFFDVQPLTVREWLRTGKLEGFKWNGKGKWRIHESAAIKLAQEMYGEKPNDLST